MKAHVIENGRIINTIEVESLDFMPNLVDASRGGKIGDLWNGVSFSDPPPAPPTREELKAIRAAAVAAIVVAVGDKTFDGDEDSQTRMARAILIAQATGLATATWTLADNTVTEVTLAELTQALALAGQKQAELWPLPT
jgi:hypothetical protein